VRRALVAVVLLGFMRTATADCEARVSWIQARLARTAHRVRVWQWGWGLFAGGSTAIQLGLVPIIDDRDTRIDLLVGAGSTLAALVPVLTAPSVDEHPDPAAVDCPARLADAERRLGAAADSERSARGPWLHVANGAFNVGVGLLLGLGWGHWTSGAFSAGVGFAVGEAQLLTIPDDSIGDKLELEKVSLVPIVVPGVTGVAVVGRF